MDAHKTKGLLRQGDVLLVRVDSIPKSAVASAQRQSGRLILAFGEITNHSHSIACSGAELFEVPSQQDLFLLVREGDALLEHQEHATVTVAPGAYRVVIQREYTPAEIRRVID
jgi:hypothetical protein